MKLGSDVYILVIYFVLLCVGVVVLLIVFNVSVCKVCLEMVDMFCVKWGDKFNVMLLFMVFIR